jgi:hypothetical protein
MAGDGLLPHPMYSGTTAIFVLALETLSWQLAGRLAGTISGRIVESRARATSSRCTGGEACNEDEQQERTFKH